jgi:hypothetical protein
VCRGIDQRFSASVLDSSYEPEAARRRNPFRRPSTRTTRAQEPRHSHAAVESPEPGSIADSNWMLGEWCLDLSVGRRLSKMGPASLSVPQLPRFDSYAAEDPYHESICPAENEVATARGGAPAQPCGPLSATSA